MCLQASSVAKRSGKEDQDEDDLCVVCWEKMRDVIFFPCMHMVRSCAFSHLKPISISPVATLICIVLDVQQDMSCSTKGASTALVHFWDSTNVRLC